MSVAYTKPGRRPLQIFPCWHVVRSDQTTAVKGFRRKDTVSVESSIPI